jgi:hypothetical protein
VFKAEKVDSGDADCSRRAVSLGRQGGSDEALGDAEYHLVLEYKIGGPLTYVSASTHCKRFAGLAVDHVLLNLSHVTRIDVDGIAELQASPPPPSPPPPARAPGPITSRGQRSGGDWLELGQYLGHCPIPWTIPGALCFGPCTASNAHMLLLLVGSVRCPAAVSLLSLLLQLLTS